MDNLLEHEGIAADLQRLGRVTLNPLRHAARDALTHSVHVAERARALGQLNGLPDETCSMLWNAGLVHDIGKIARTTNPQKSVEILTGHGIGDEHFLALVKHHDIALPWLRSAQKGQVPGDRAWGRLAASLDMRLLMLLMVADRVDAPGGWRRNEPSTWFLAQAGSRSLLPDDLLLDVDGDVWETRVVVVAVSDGRLLVEQTDGGGLRLPQAPISWDENPQEVARKTLGIAGVEGGCRFLRRLPVTGFVVSEGNVTQRGTLLPLHFRMSRRTAGRWDAVGDLEALPTNDPALLSFRSLPALLDLEVADRDMLRQPHTVV